MKNTKIDLFVENKKMHAENVHQKYMLKKIKKIISDRGLGVKADLEALQKIIEVFKNE